MTDPLFFKNPPSVLMVDDTPANLKLLSGMLNGRGYKVRAAVSGEMALQVARNEPPDLILLDINMPEMDGYEVCSKLKADEKLKDIPVIFLSALNETVDKVKAFGAGGVDYITKPFQFEEVEARVETHLELRRQKLELQENYNKLRELEKLRDSMVHLIVHDLRSPLSAICAFLGFLREDAKGALSAQAAQDIDEALKGANRMIIMVSDLLDASKLEDGKMKLNLEECDLAAVLENTIAAMRPLARGRLITIEHASGPVKALVDAELVARVTQNLLSNALKYAPAEGGYVRLELRPAGGAIRVSVANNGPAIPPEHQSNIFEKFSQVETRRAKNSYSTGLGLSFCKLAAEAHGGSVGVSSEQGGETVFWFELPAKGPAAKAAQTQGGQGTGL